MLWGESIEKVKKPTGSQAQDISGLSHQFSVSEPWQPDDHRPSQCSMCAALNASVAHLASTAANEQDVASYNY